MFFLNLYRNIQNIQYVHVLLDKQLFIYYYYFNRNVADRLKVILKYINLWETTHLETCKKKSI